LEPWLEWYLCSQRTREQSVPEARTKKNKKKGEKPGSQNVHAVTMLWKLLLCEKGKNVVGCKE